jgi:Putative metal-binding motif/Secretion system C-terminal sorting domain
MKHFNFLRKAPMLGLLFALFLLPATAVFALVDADGDGYSIGNPSGVPTASDHVTIPIGTDQNPYTPTLANNEEVLYEMTSNDPSVDPMMATINEIVMSQTLDPSCYKIQITTGCSGYSGEYVFTSSSNGTGTWNLTNNRAVFFDGSNWAIVDAGSLMFYNFSSSFPLPPTTGWIAYADNACGAASITSFQLIPQSSTPSVSIAANVSGTILTGTSVTFTATPTNGGTTPVYQWKMNGGANVGTNSNTYTYAGLANGDIITCQMTSSSTLCANPTLATSNAIVMAVSLCIPVTEICNGLDEDCDGVADDGLTFLNYYVDTDGDTYGAGTATNACAAIAGSVTNNFDCAPTNAAAFPGANEVCNGLDENCNSQADEGLTTLEYYPDTDSDGYGFAGPMFGSSVYSCAPVPGHVTNNLDCNNSNSSIHPNATEVCNGIDDDCDNTPDEGIAITPTFAPVATCAGTAISPLPTTSTNGIQGTWSPAISAATTTYLFTPNAGQCAITPELNVTVNALPIASISPAVATIGCSIQGSTILLTASSTAGGPVIVQEGSGSGTGGTGQFQFEPVIFNPTWNISSGFTYHITPTGPTASWSNNLGSALTANAPLGTFTVTITDANGCTGVSSRTVTQGTLACAPVTINPIATVSGSNVTFNWTAGCYKFYRVQYRRVLPTAGSSWLTKTVNVATATNMSATVAQPGTYKWGLVGGCISNNSVSTLAAGTNFVVGGQNLQSANDPTVEIQQVTMAPNPAKDYAEVRMEFDNATVAIIRVQNLEGKVVFTDVSDLDSEHVSVRTINTDAMPTGMYIVQVVTDGGYAPVVNRLLVQH